MAGKFRQARTKAGLPKNLVLYCGRPDFGTRVLKKTGNLMSAPKIPSAPYTWPLAKNLVEIERRKQRDILHRAETRPCACLSTGN